MNNGQSGSSKTSDKQEMASDVVRLRGTGEKHPTGGIKSSLHGLACQLNILLLFMKRALLLDYEFSITTEHGLADKFDDLIFKYKQVKNSTQYNCRFLQAKHKQAHDKKLVDKDLTNESGDYSVPMYYDSYRKIKTEGPFKDLILEDFILYTNIGVHENLVKSFKPLKETDSFLDFELESIRTQTEPLELALKSKLYKELVGLCSVFGRILKDTERYKNLGVHDELEKSFKQSKHVKLLLDFKPKNDVEPHPSRLVIEDKSSLYIEICELCLLFERNLKQLLEGNLVDDDTLQKNIKQLKQIHSFADHKLKKDEKPKPKRLLLDNESKLYKELTKILLKPYREFVDIAKLLGKYAANHLIEITPKLKNNHYWIMEKVFLRVNENDSNNYKFRDEFLNPSKIDDMMTECSNAFYEAYHIRQNNISSATAKVTKDQREKIREDLSEESFQLARYFLEMKSTKKEYVAPNEIEVKEFLGKLVFAVDQPSEDEMMDIVAKEIGEHMKLVNSDLAVGLLRACVMDWVSDKHGQFVTRNDIDKLFDQVKIRLAEMRQAGLTQGHKDTILSYRCSFLDKGTFQQLKNFFTNNDAKLLLVYYSEKLLTDIKLMQLKLNAKMDDFIYIDIKSFIDTFDSEMSAFRIFELKNEKQLFITFSDKSEINSNILNKISELFQLLTYSCKRKLVFLIPYELRFNFENLISNLKGDVSKTVVEDTKNCFDDLTTESQENIVNGAKLKFRGFEITLKTLIDENLKSHLIDSVLADLIRGAYTLKFACGTSHIIDLYEEMKDYFLERKVQRRIVVSNDVYKDINFCVVNESQNISKNIAQDIIVLTDSIKVYDEICNCSQNPNIHWLKKYDLDLVWQKSKGTIKNIMKYEKVGNGNKQGPFSDNITLKTVFDLNDRIVIISAAPGMGKSTILSHIAGQTVSLANSEEFCLIMVSLKDFCSQLTALPSQTLSVKDALVLLYQYFRIGLSNELNTVLNKQHIRRLTKIFKTDHEGQLEYSIGDEIKLDMLKLKLFTYLYNESKLIVLFDGFDEIPTCHIKTMIKLFETLKSSRLQKLWVTTRPYNNIKEDLQITLNTFAYTLSPFDHNEQIVFLKKFWQQNLDIDVLEIVHIKNFLEKNIPTKFIQDNVSSSKNKSVFLGIPQHNLMIATIYSEKFLNFHENIDVSVDQSDEESEIDEIMTIYDLYTSFFRIKFMASKGLRLEHILDTDYECLMQMHRNRHEKLGLMEIVDTDLLEELVPSKEQSALREEVMKGDLKTGLVLRVVDNRPNFIHRTYAEYFAASALATELQCPSTNPNRLVAKKILYNILSTNKILTFPNIIIFFNYKIVAGSPNASVFYAAMENDREKFLPIQKYIHIRDDLGRTPAHILFSSTPIFCNSTLNTHYTLSTFMQNNDISSLNFIFDTDDLFQWTPIHYNVACHNCYNLSVNFSEANLQFGEKKDLKDEFGLTPYMLAIQRKCNVNCIWAFLRGLPLNLDAKDNQGNTILHHTLKLSKTNITFHFMAYYLIDNGADLLVENNEHEIPLNMMIGRYELLKLAIPALYEKSKDYFNKFCKEKVAPNGDFCTQLLCQSDLLTLTLLKHSEIKVNSRNSKGKTALHLIIKRASSDEHFAIRSNDILLNLIKNGADIQALDNKHRLPSYYNKKNILKIFLEGKSARLFSYIDRLTKKKSNVMKKFILTMEFPNDIAVHVLSRYESLADILINSNKVNVNVTDVNGRNALHYAVMYCRECNVEDLLRKNIDVNAKDKQGKTPIEYLTGINANDSQETAKKILTLLIHFGANYDVTNTVIQNIEIIDCIQQLFDAVKSSNVPLEKIKEVLSFCTDVEIVVNARSKDDGRPIHCAVSNGRSDIVKLLLSYGAVYNSFGINNKTPNELTDNSEILEILNLTDQFFAALEKDDHDKVVNLINQGAILNAGCQKPPFIVYGYDIAVEKKKGKIVNLLLSSGVNKDLKGNSKNLRDGNSSSKILLPEIDNRPQVEFTFLMSPPKFQAEHGLPTMLLSKRDIPPSSNLPGSSNS